MKPRCGDCDKALGMIEIAFGRFNDPVCGRCLIIRKQRMAEMEQQAEDAANGNLIAHLHYEE